MVVRERKNHSRWLQCDPGRKVGNYWRTLGSRGSRGSQRQSVPGDRSKCHPPSTPKSAGSSSTSAGALGHPPRAIAEALHVSHGFQKKIVRLSMNRHGQTARTRCETHHSSCGERVAAHGRTAQPPRCRNIQTCCWLHHVACERANFVPCLRSANVVQVLQHYALRRVSRGLSLLTMINTFYSLHRLLVGDETAKHKGD